MASEEFKANVRCRSRREGYQKFAMIAGRYFQCSPTHLIITCYRAGIASETVDRDSGETTHTYEITFGAEIKDKEEPSTEPAPSE